MASNHIIFFVFSLFAIVFSVEADKALIQKLCGATFSPAICTDCIKSHPSSESATDTQLITMLVDCSISDLGHLGATTFQLITNATDANVKDVLSQCNNGFNVAFNDNSGLQRHVISRAFKEAKQTIRLGILPKVNNCTDLVKSRGIPMPSPVFSGVDIVDGDYRIVYQVLESLN